MLRGPPHTCDELAGSIHAPGAAGDLIERIEGADTEIRRAMDVNLLLAHAVQGSCELREVEPSGLLEIHRDVDVLDTLRCEDLALTCDRMLAAVGKQVHDDLITLHG